MIDKGAAFPLECPAPTPDELAEEARLDAEYAQERAERRALIDEHEAVSKALRHLGFDARPFWGEYADEPDGITISLDDAKRLLADRPAREAEPGDIFASGGKYVPPIDIHSRWQERATGRVYKVIGYTLEDVDGLLFEHFVLRHGWSTIEICGGVDGAARAILEHNFEPVSE